MTWRCVFGVRFSPLSSSTSPRPHVSDDARNPRSCLWHEEKDWIAPGETTIRCAALQGRGPTLVFFTKEKGLAAD
eukprot:3605609-Rhodomonas_salina.3